MPCPAWKRDTTPHGSPTVAKQTAGNRPRHVAHMLFDDRPCTPPFSGYIIPCQMLTSGSARHSTTDHCDVDHVAIQAAPCDELLVARGLDSISRSASCTPCAGCSTLFTDQTSGHHRSHVAGIAVQLVAVESAISEALCNTQPASGCVPSYHTATLTR